MRLDADLEEWLKTTPPGRRTESTMREYERRLRRHVMPVIGHKKLRSLTVVDVERMLRGCADQGLGRESIRGVRNALAAAHTTRSGNGSSPPTSPPAPSCRRSRRGSRSRAPRWRKSRTCSKRHVARRWVICSRCWRARAAASVKRLVRQRDPAGQILCRPHQYRLRHQGQRRQPGVDEARLFAPTADCDQQPADEEGEPDAPADLAVLPGHSGSGDHGQGNGGRGHDPTALPESGCPCAQRAERGQGHSRRPGDGAGPDPGASGARPVEAPIGTPAAARASAASVAICRAPAGRTPAPPQATRSSLPCGPGASQARGLRQPRLHRRDRSCCSQANTAMRALAQAPDTELGLRAGALPGVGSWRWQIPFGVTLAAAAGRAYGPGRLFGTVGTEQR